MFWWLTFTAVLAGLAATHQDTLRVRPTCRVKGQPEIQLTLNCGDGTNAGVVQYWHTPFGELHSPRPHSQLEPAFMHVDGSLVIPNSSALHSGLYYCLLQHAEAAALWPYELHVGHKRHERPSSSCASGRFSRDVGSEGKQADVSDQVFAGAVAASVLLTFVFGFSIGALSRTHVLRFLGVVTKRLRLSRQQTDTVDSVTVTTVPPTSQGFEMGNLQDDDSVNGNNMDTTASSTASSPPTKPQRSFRHKKEEQQETAAYLEKCDYKETERNTEEEAGKRLEERHEEERAGEGSQSETDTGREGTEGTDGGQRSEERECRQEEEEEAKVEESKSKKDGGSEEEKTNKDEERQEEEKGRKDDGEKAKTAEDTGSESEDSGSDGRTQEDRVTNSTTAAGEEEEASSPPCPAPRSRVIRLYQYDEDGQRYSHLPDPAPDDPVPVPRPKQRTRSLTRLSAIMAAASAGPLDRRDTGREDEEDGTRFHMDV